MLTLIEPQPFKGQTRLLEARLDGRASVIVGEQNDFHPGLQKNRDDIRLKKIDERQSVISDDEDSF
jgi:hypothetical protein